jgi:hypothetical protein
MYPRQRDPAQGQDEPLAQLAILVPPDSPRLRVRLVRIEPGRQTHAFIAEALRERRA